ncbi:MAG: RIO1 family regulatory kinase/ATPase [Limnothrix sp.]
MATDFVLGYPTATPDILAARHTELAAFRLTKILDYGAVNLGQQAVLGLGYVGIVVLVERDRQQFALKIRRTNIDKLSLVAEAEYLQQANTVNIAPQVVQWSENFILMEYIVGESLFIWVQRMSAMGKIEAIKLVIKNLLKQSFRLDQLGLDRGDMSCVTNDVVVRNEEPVLLDFSRASGDRRPQNVTALVQGLFWGSALAKYLQPTLSHCTKDQLLPLLRAYKQQQTTEHFAALTQAIFR